MTTATNSINTKDVYVVYTDSHFVLIHAPSQESAKALDGKILGHYLSSETANNALDTMRTIEALGYPLQTRS